MRSLSFVVHGEPAPQGSKTVAKSSAGRTFVREDNPGTAPWRNAVVAAATAALNGTGPLAGEVRLDVDFVFGRPKGHYGTGRNAGVLKPSAPTFCSKRPDLDKLLRAVGDALTGTALVDDATIVELRASKRYGRPAALVTLCEIRGSS